MTPEEIHAELDKMLADPKSKGFLNHLVYSYMPVTKVEKVFDKPKGIFKCVLTREELLSVQDIFEGMQTEEFKTDFMNQLKSMLDQTGDRTTAMAKLIGDKKLGVSGSKTDTFMSVPAFQEFYNWVTTKALQGDKHINWLLTSIRRASSTDGRKPVTNDNTKKEFKPKPYHKNEKPVGPATYTLGDLGVLQKLKAEIKKNEI